MCFADSIMAIQAHVLAEVSEFFRVGDNESGSQVHEGAPLNQRKPSAEEGVKYRGETCDQQHGRDHRGCLLLRSQQSRREKEFSDKEHSSKEPKREDAYVGASHGGHEDEGDEHERARERQVVLESEKGQVGCKNYLKK